ncbi:hypothetical protein BJ322DRAFT_1113175 [Thelephora terrestris]|uniref:Uncharacterized protein n=1 Tax=Thelephora terrestris TaxID=56493 RepID=A0A9P6H5U7_9AGAM|nr:hypothetical protein BJ322DRAFT_1113175 [Thelephora terrestris]
MAPPHLLLDALSDSIASGTFIDTKFYAFTRRDAHRRVCAPRALYGNSHILGTIPYFSTLFSEGFSEGNLRHINDGFPSDSHPYTEDYDYLSDSDLEDGSSCLGEDPEEADDVNSQQILENAEVAQPAVSNSLPPAPLELNKAQDHNRSTPLPVRCFSTFVNLGHSASDDPPRMGKVAIVRDTGAVTFEALLYFLFTDEINFAPLSSDPRHEPAQARVGDWSAGKPPSPSAKSIYRLADMYDIPTLKERAMAHIRNNLGYCDIIGEIFSSFTYFFPEILSMQVSFLVNKMNEESKGGAEGPTRTRLRTQIASLSRSEMRRATDALVMIWNCIKEPLKPPTTQPKADVSVASANLPNWQRVQLALLKSITTGIFIDVQFYACNKVFDDLPVDPKPLFISSIVIEQWGPAITTQTVGTACLVDGPIDDYEKGDGKPLSETHGDETALTYRTEAPPAENREVVLLNSGAWKTWLSFFSYAYRNEMMFLPLQTPANVSNSGAPTCSPRSAYSLATTLGIVGIKEVASKDIQSQLSASNIMQELFSSFSVSNEAIMEMEIDFLHNNVIEKNPKLLTDYIRSMASGESPFFPTALSLVYDGLVGKTFSKQHTFTFGSNSFPGAQSVTTPTPLQPSTWTSTTASSSTSNTVSSAKLKRLQEGGLATKIDDKHKRIKRGSILFTRTAGPLPPRTFRRLLDYLNKGAITDTFIPGLTRAEHGT